MTKQKAEQDSPYTDAHTIALDLLKQLITLSSGVLALSAAFIESLYPETTIQILTLIASWLCFAGSIYSGLQAMSAIVQSRLTPGYDWSKGIGRVYAGASKYLFISGIVVFAVFALISFLAQ
ncbi:MAG: hypothetical protein HXY35_05775 [Chloroflexi bacterium]|nr:hypothetical protein [Chloroflexota bacterium]